MIKKSPYLSVIIPTLNEEKLLNNCLSSLAKQITTYTYEIIVVDTNSIDKTKQIAHKFKTRVITESKLGKNIAFQTGAMGAAGQILCFTEADCVLPPHWLDEIGKFFREYSAAVAVSGGYRFYKTNWWYQILSYAFLPLSVYIFKIFWGHHSFRCSNFAIRKDAFGKIGGFNPNNYELYDVELSRKASKLGPIYYLTSITIATADRRIRGRFFKFLKEFMVSFVNVGILNKPISRSVYSDIR